MEENWLPQTVEYGREEILQVISGLCCYRALVAKLLDEQDASWVRQRTEEIESLEF
jgi:hypothetical protein